MSTPAITSYCGTWWRDRIKCRRETSCWRIQPPMRRELYKGFAGRGMNLEPIADTFLRYRAKKLKEDSWAFDSVWRMVREEPEAALELTLLLLRKAGDDDGVLAYVAAGPLEDLLTLHGLQVIDRIEQESRRDSRLQLALSGVWGINPGHPVFERWYNLMRMYGFADGKRPPL
jgi:hypothetical protein